MLSAGHMAVDPVESHFTGNSGFGDDVWWRNE